MGKSLRQMFEIKENPSSSASGHALEPGAQEISLVANSLHKLTSALQAAQAQGAAAYSGLGHSAQEWSSVATKATSQAITLLTRQNLLEASSVTAHGRAEQTKSLASVSALKQTAFYKALAATAAGFQALGALDFWSAAEDFTAASLWGVVAGGQIASMAGSDGGSRSKTARQGQGEWNRGQGSDSTMASPVSALSAGAASASVPPTGSLTVAIMGDNEAGEWLAKTLNTAVEQRGVQLTSTRSTRSPYAQG
ncbi:MAG: hypothetical protein ACRD1I_00035 [Terriglobia bacterium]